ncbi:hypothetical protein ACWM0Y_07540 [Lactiplantibacillus plantarum]
MIKSVRGLIERLSKCSTQHPLRTLVSLIVLVIVIIPFGLQLVMAGLSFGIFKIGTNDGWLGFWGGYLGSIIAIGGVYWQVRKQIRFEESKQLPRLVPIEGKIKIDGVLLDQHKLLDKESKYNGVESFCELEIPILNGGNSVIYDCRCTYKMLSFGELDKRYKEINEERFGIKIENENSIYYIKADNSVAGGIVNRRYTYSENWQCTVPYIDAKKVGKLNVPITIVPLIKFLAYKINTGIKNPNSYFPTYEVNVKFKDIEMNEHEINYKIKVNFVTINNASKENKNFSFSFSPYDIKN